QRRRIQRRMIVDDDPDRIATSKDCRRVTMGGRKFEDCAIADHRSAWRGHRFGLWPDLRRCAAWLGCRRWDCGRRGWWGYCWRRYFRGRSNRPSKRLTTLRGEPRRRWHAALLRRQGDARSIALRREHVDLDLETVLAILECGLRIGLDVDDRGIAVEPPRGAF